MSQFAVPTTTYKNILLGMVDNAVITGAGFDHSYLTAVQLAWEILRLDMECK